MIRPDSIGGREVIDSIVLVPDAEMLMPREMQDQRDSGLPRDLTITGRCLCGAVTYTVDAEPVWQGVCYCSNCQRQTATAFSVIVGVPSKALTVEGDTLASFKTASEGYESTTERRFCSACGSPIFSTIESMPGLAFLKAGTIDDPSWFEPTVEIWTRSAQPWAPHFENATRYDGIPHD